jgi:hypothetical protein
LAFGLLTSGLVACWSNPANDCRPGPPVNTSAVEGSWEVSLLTEDSLPTLTVSSMFFVGGFECVQGGGTICTGSVCQTTTECNGPTLPSTCTIDADCPTGWTCEPDTAESTECVPTMHSCPPTGCPPLTGRMACRPPYWELVGDIRWTGAAFTPGICPVVEYPAIPATALSPGRTAIFRDTSSELTAMVVVLSSRVLATPPVPISTSGWATGAF